MTDFRIHTLGCGSAKPTLRHQPSSTVVEYRGNLMMIDCGEGAQTALQRQHLSFSRLNHIFLTHLHGDHVFGLPGLIGTLNLSGNGGDITIHTFEQGAEMLSRILDFFSPGSPVQVRFNVIDPHRESTVYESRSLRVRAIPLDHRIDCVGYLVEEKPGLRHLDRDACDRYGVPMSWYNRIKAGDDYFSDSGVVIPNSVLSTPADKPRGYAHMSDTAYMPGLAAKIEGVDLLFHETTYLNDQQKTAAERGHSTAEEAARVARDAHAGRLLTGHYSSRYRDDLGFLEEASRIFPHVVLNREGLVTEV